MWSDHSARISLATLAVVGAVVFGFPWWAAALLGVACVIMIAGVLPGVLSVAIGLALVAVLYPSGWEWTVSAEYMVMTLLLARQTNAALSGGAVGPGLGFMPLRAITLLWLRGV
jgi:hypothetical protein